jgi:hypothetical protein
MDWLGSDHVGTETDTQATMEDLCFLRVVHAEIRLRVVPLESVRERERECLLTDSNYQSESRLWSLMHVTVYNMELISCSGRIRRTTRQETVLVCRGLSAKYNKAAEHTCLPRTSEFPDHASHC